MTDITNDFDADDPGHTSDDAGIQQQGRLSPVQPGYAASSDDRDFDDDLDNDLDDDERERSACEAQEADDGENAAAAPTGLQPIVPGQTGGFGIADVLFPASPPPVRRARVIRSFG